eukprot:3830065-Alexandrium_andersonii.AAC.1
MMPSVDPVMLPGNPPRRFFIVCERQPVDGVAADRCRAHSPEQIALDSPASYVPSTLSLIHI